MEHFQNTLTCLEFQLDEHHEQFDTLYGHLSIEEIEAIEDSIGFSNWQPLIDFESTLNFTSRRSIIEDAILDWEANTSLGFDDDPDNLDGWSDEFRTLLNYDLEVMIDTQIYNYDFDNLDDSLTSNEANLRSECRWYGKKITHHHFQNNSRTIKLKTTFYGGFIMNKIKCKVVHYKNKKRKRAPISAQVGAWVVDIHCRELETMGNTKGTKKRRWRRVVDRKYEPVIQGRFGECSVVGGTNVDYGNHYFCHKNWGPNCTCF
jgi:hypothetical protein